MVNVTEKQMSYLLQLANKLTGEGARYASQSSIGLDVRTAAEASAMIDELQDAIKAHAKWQAETGLVPGAAVRREYVTKDGNRIVISGEIDGYVWSGTEVSVLRFSPDADTRAVTGWGDTCKLALARLGAEVAVDAKAALEAERAALLARVAEIDAILAQS